MSLVELAREGDVFVLRMNAGENRFNRAFVEALGSALDEVEKSSGPAALVTIGAQEKFYSNGLDLDWMMAQGQDGALSFASELVRFLGRLLAFPVPTVAALNGHVFAAGAMLAMAHDYRVMRADRGFFCLPEIDLGLPVGAGMMGLLRSRLSPSNLRDTLLTGARIGGADACERGIVDEAVAGDEVLPRAIARAGALAAKDRAIYGTLKRAIYADALEVLERGAV